MLAGCQSAETLAPAVMDRGAKPPVSTSAESLDRSGDGHREVPPATDRLPVDQLARVRRATARYQDVANAIADGYVDIDVVIPNMGRHFLNQDRLDGRFELERPELLVYAPQEHGRLELVAVEYAVPLSLAARAPEGFRGNTDQWFTDQTFQLWTVHAWVWKENPDGVFHMTNRRVPQAK